MDETQVKLIIEKPKNDTALVDGAIGNTATELVMSQFWYTQRYCGTGTTYGPARRIKRAVIEQIFTFAATANQAFTLQLPPFSEVVATAITLDSAVVLSTATNLGIGSGNAAGNGSDSNLGLFGSTMTINSQYADWPFGGSSATTARGGANVNANGASPLTIYLNAVASNGSGAGSITSGTIRAYVIYDYLELPAHL